LKPYTREEDVEVYKLLRKSVELSEISRNLPFEPNVTNLHSLLKMKNFFGQTFITIKSHMLEHKAADYERFGQNWTHSTFQPEK